MMMLQLAPIAILLTVASQCARNMIQTADVRKLAIAAAAAADYSSSSSCPLTEWNGDSKTSIPGRLQTMNRGELLRVFANGRAPTPTELNEWFSCETDDTTTSAEGNVYCSEWDGMLLDNNGFFMDASSTILTNNLFGGILLPWRLMGEPSRAKGMWTGKNFAKPTVSGTAGRGSNRFAGRDATNNPSPFQRHEFDFDVVKSKILGNNSNNLALRLDYSRYQSLPISLWWSMRDELRVIDYDLPNNNNKDDNPIVMIGMGWMGWSGGALNCSPFMLELPRRKQPST